MGDNQKKKKTFNIQRPLDFRRKTCVLQSKTFSFSIALCGDEGPGCWWAHFKKMFCLEQRADEIARPEEGNFGLKHFWQHLGDFLSRQRRVWWKLIAGIESPEQSARMSDRNTRLMRGSPKTCPVQRRSRIWTKEASPVQGQSPFLSKVEVVLVLSWLIAFCSFGRERFQWFCAK